MAYNALGDPLSLTDPNGEVTSYTYNAAGQVSGITLADGSTMTYTYDSQGNLITATDRHGRDHAHLRLGRPADQRRLSRRPVAPYTYNTGGLRTQMVEKQGRPSPRRSITRTTRSAS